MSDVTQLYIKIDSKGVVTAGKTLKELRQQAQKTTPVIDDTTGATDKLNRSSKGTAGSLSALSSGFKTVGRDLQRYGLALVGAATAVTKFSFDLTNGLGQVQTLIPNTGDRIYELRDAVQALAVETGVSSNDISTGLYQTISAFQDSADTMGILTTATKAAVAGGASVADSIALASAVTKAYGDTSAEAVQKVLDLSFETVRLGQTTFPELANGIQIATDSAVRLGVSQEELFAIYSSLTGVLGDASEASTKFRSASASLLNPNAKLTKLFEALGRELNVQITTGEDFVKAAGGIQGALSLIIDTAMDSDEPLQKYVRRIEGITLASRVASTSAEKYASDLNSMQKATGALNDAFDEVDDGIDKFHRDILKSKEQIIASATAIGDNLVPMLAELMQQIADASTYFASFDDELQQTLISLGQVVVVAGPVLIFIGSLLRMTKLFLALKASASVQALVALIGGPVGLVVALAVLVGGVITANYHMAKHIQVIKEQREAYAKAQGEQHDYMLSLDTTAKAQLDLNDAGELGETTIKDLTEKYPDLVEEVGAYAVAIAAAKVEMTNLHREEKANEAKDIFVADIPKIEDAVGKYNLVSTMYKENLRKIIDSRKKYIEAMQKGNDIGATIALDELNSARDFTSDLLEEKTKANEAVNELMGALSLKAEDLGLEAFRTGVGVNFRAINVDLEDFLVEVRKKIAGGLSLEEDPPELLTWQEWFEKITGIAKEKFGGSGAQAANAFMQSFQGDLSQEEVFADIFGEDVDYISFYEEQLDTLKEKFKELTAVQADEVKLGEYFKVKGINAKEFDNTMETLSEDIRIVQKLLAGSNTDYFRDQIKQVNAFAKAFPDLISEEDRLRQVLSLQEDRFDSLKGKLDPMSMGYQVLAGEILKTKEAMDALNDSSDGQEKKVMTLKDVWDDYKVSLASLGLDAVSDTFYEIGMAMSDSSDSISSFADAVTHTLKAVLDALPAMFIQAGLQLLIDRNPLGWGFIAMGLSGSFLSGLNQGIADSNDPNKKEENAKGGVYTKAYAKGGALGSFENSIVNTPTLFNNGAGLMGEAGAEAIIPLTRTSSGDLGIASVGGSANVSVTIINNTGSEVSQKEIVGSDGSKELQITIGKMVNQALSNGTADKSMQGRYGVKVKGRN